MNSLSPEALFAALQCLTGSSAHVIEPLRAPVLENNASPDKRNEAFRRALEILSTPDDQGALDDAGIAGFVEFFDILYDDPGYRHMYSDVCEVMFGCLKTEDTPDEEAPVQALSLANNIEIIAVDFERSRPNSPAAKSVMKLKDHIQLEQTRIKYMVKQNKWQRASWEEVKNTQREAGETLAAFREKLELAEEENRGTLDAAKRDYVTILGIFASIVIAFTAGSAYTSSVLANIAAVGAYRLVFVVLLIGLVLFNLISLLLYFVAKVSGVKGDGAMRRASIWGNVSIGVAMVMVLVARYFQWL